MNATPSDRKEIRALICHRDVDLGILCLGSLARFCYDPIQILLHEDGSLTNEDRAKLADALPDVVMISKDEADATLDFLLRDFPRCAAFRQRSATGMKLLDTSYYASRDIILMDTDIMFFQPFRAAFTWPNDDVQCIFLHDRTNSYCWLPWETGGLEITNQFNCGMMMLRKPHFSFETMERLIRVIEDSEGYKRREPYQWFLEQTCWAAISGGIESRRWHPRQMRVIASYDTYDRALVAGHFVKSVRPKLYQFAEAAKAAGSADWPPVTVELAPARRYSTPRFYANRIANRLRALKKA